MTTRTVDDFSRFVTVEGSVHRVSINTILWCCWPSSSWQVFASYHQRFWLWRHLPSVLWPCWLGGRKGFRPAKKTEWWGAGVVICLERDADLHMAQLMPVPLTVSCFSKIQIGFTFLVPAHPGSPEQRAVKRVCVFWWWKKQKGLANPGLPGVEMAVKTVLMYCHASAPIL